MKRATASQRIGHVRLNGALFYAFHGVSESERRLGAQFAIDLDITCDIARSALSDKLADALNYEAVYACVGAVMLSQPVQLMESIASRIIDDLFTSFPAALEIDVSVRKLNP